MGKIRINPWLPAVLCLLWRFTPEGSFLPFLLAVSFHEAGHIAAINLCGGKISSASLSPMGVILSTGPLPYWKEAICALAGPLSSILLVLFRQVFPWLAFWGLAQAVINFLPVFPLDGGRFIQCILSCTTSADRAWTVSRVISVSILAALILLLLYAAAAYRLFRLIVPVCIVLLARTGKLLRKSRFQLQISSRKDKMKGDFEREEFS